MYPLNGAWMTVMKKNIKATDRRVSIEIRGEMLHDGEFCENPVGWSSMCESPIETVE